MKRSGRISLLLVFAIVGVAVLAVLALMSGGSPSTTAARFLTALQMKDVKTLVELSDVDDQGKASLEQKLSDTVNVAGKHYNFTWRIVATQLDGDTAVVKLLYTKNSDSLASYEENVDLPLVKKDGVWKVTLFEVPRKLYPGLPRADSLK